MGILVSLLLFLPLSLWVAYNTACKGDRAALIRLVSLAWIIMTPLLVFVNAAIPFTGGGDDETYYLLAATPIDGFSEYFNFSKFSHEMDQPGYAWILHLLNAITGQNLLALKLINLFFLILLALIWYRLGLLLESRRFAIRVAVVILCLTPLWYYVFFLLKDLTIVLIQSAMLLLSVQIWHQTRFRSLALFIALGGILTLFRLPVVMQSGAVLAGSLVAKGFVQKADRKYLFSITLVALTLTFGLIVLTDPKILYELGITSLARVYGTVEFNELMDNVTAQGGVRTITYVVNYLFTETSGMTIAAWEQLDAFWLRGLLSLPWLYFLFPFFLLGIWELTRISPSIQRESSPFSKLLQRKFLSTPWNSVVLFVLTSFYISWTTGDATRWRIPDMPMIAAIAVLGWSYSTSRSRANTVLMWIVSAGMFFATYYLIMG